MGTDHRTGNSRHIGRHVTSMCSAQQATRKVSGGSSGPAVTPTPDQQQEGIPGPGRAGTSQTRQPPGVERTGSRQHTGRLAGPAKLKNGQRSRTAAKVHGRRCSAAKGGWYPGSGNDRQGVLWLVGQISQTEHKGAGPGELGQHMYLDAWERSGCLADGGGIWHAGGRAHGAAEHGARSGQLRR